MQLSKCKSGNTNLNHIVQTSNQASTSTTRKDKDKSLYVTYDGKVDWSAYGEQMEKDFALMAYIVDDDKVQKAENVESKYPPLPNDVKDNVCTKAYLNEVNHYRNHAFVLYDRLQAEMKNHKKIKEEQKESKSWMRKIFLNINYNDQSVESYDRCCSRN